MFENVEELKKFILWAKSEKIQSVKVGTLEVQFSALALAPELYTNTIRQTSDAPEQTLEQQNEDNELLYHSSIP